MISTWDILASLPFFHLKHMTGLDLIDKLKTKRWQICQATEIKAVAPWRLSEERGSSVY
jgi:hypothetical protein